MEAHLLTWLLATPLLGLGLILVLPRDRVRLIQGVAIATTAVALLLSLRVWALFQPGVGTMQCEEQAAWIASLNITYHVGIDGISLPLVLLTTLLCCLACLASLGIAERQKEYFTLYLLLETGMVGTFLALDLFLFYIFWEVVL
ncbi:MAG: NADH-quinone oxidoreductase subunit M, partial [Candidatus Omnitrophica bacterium]|nr:NADH-quinone oxidoreductase subunit M [Candidatus Omnitrophota bacterium]